MYSYYKYTKDLLNREESAKFFVDDFLDTNLNCVVGLNGEYGSGKSVFIKLCSEYINKKKDINSILINVAENEFEDNPSFTILNGIISKIYSEDIDIGEIEAIGRLLLDMTSKENINLSSDSLSIKNYLMKNRGHTKKQFKYKMEKLLEEKNLIVFLDDLDRCSPYFAIRILEELKYYFKFISGITFVIAYDRNQLESFIRVKFGTEIDTNGYLAKFFDLRYIFNSVNKDKFLNELFEKCKNLMDCENLKDKFETIKNSILDDKEMMELLSLRDLQQLVLKITQGLANSKDTAVDQQFSEVITLLSYLRILDWKLYMELYRKRIGCEDGVETIKENNSFKTIHENRLMLLNGGKDNYSFSPERLKIVFEILENDKGYS